MTEEVADVFGRAEALLPDLPAREARVAQALLADYPMAGLRTVAELASRAGVSTATVLRFVNRLGFAVYADFQAALRRHLEEALQSPLARLATTAARGLEGSSFFDAYAAAMIGQIETVRRTMPAGEFRAAVELLADPKREIHVLGGRYSSSVGRYLVDLLKALRGKVRYVDGQTQAWPQELLDFGRGTVLVALDVRRYQDDVVTFARLAAERGSTVVLLSDQWHSPAARHAAHLLAFPVASPSVFDSLVVGLVVVEALVGAVAARLGPSSRTRIELLERLRRPLAPVPSAPGEDVRPRNREDEGC